MDEINVILQSIRTFCDVSSDINIRFNSNDECGLALRRILLKQILKYEDHMDQTDLTRNSTSNILKNFVTFDELDEALENLKIELENPE